MKRRALVYGYGWSLMQAVPAVLSRAGFEVTLVSVSKKLRKCRYVDRFTLVRGRKELLARIEAEVGEGYDLVIAGDDRSLREVCTSNLPVATKLKLLPVTGPEGLDHLGSKIGLSKVLRRAGVETPVFATASDDAELDRAVTVVGYPLLVKGEHSGSGKQVFNVESDADLARLRRRLTYPVLVQQRVQGELVDCSGYFHNGHPVNFGLAVVLTAQRDGFGPSVLRRYLPGGAADPATVAQMRQLGEALCANGFVSITGIRLRDGRISFFEADMRPNVWIEFPKYYGDDPATAIAAAFDGKTIPQPAGLPESIVLPYLPRMQLIDIVLNRYQCWSRYENYASRNFLVERIIEPFEDWTLRRVSKSIKARWQASRDRRADLR